jgi:hypothetical protein
LYAQFARVDVSRLHRHADLGIAVAQGRGAVRVPVDVERGQWMGGTVDLALADVNTTLAETLQPLVLPSVQGRLGRGVWRGHGGFDPGPAVHHRRRVALARWQCPHQAHRGAQGQPRAG